MLLKVLSLVGLLALADAGISLSKRDGSLQGAKKAYFVKQFRYTLFHIIATEKADIEIKVEELKTETTKCKNLITARQAECKECAKDECTPSTSEKIKMLAEKGGEIIAYPFVEFSKLEIWSNIGDFFEGVGSGFLNWSGWSNMRDFFKNVGDWDGWDDIGDFFEGLDDLDIGDLTSGLNDIDWGGMWDWTGDVGDFFGGLFRRKKRSIASLNTRERRLLSALYQVWSDLRRRDIDPEVQACMSKCAVCSPFLQTDTMVSSICGEEFVTLNTTVYSTIEKLQSVYQYVRNSTNPIVTDLSYTDALETYITARFANGYVKYKSEQPYTPTKLGKLAALTALEYWEKP